MIYLLTTLILMLPFLLPAMLLSNRRITWWFLASSLALCLFWGWLKSDMAAHDPGPAGGFVVMHFMLLATLNTHICVARLGIIVWRYLSPGRPY